MARQYGGLTRKYGSDGGDELAACLPPDLRHLLSATTAATPQSHHRQTTTQRLQQHGLLQRSSAATAAANSLNNTAAMSLYGVGGTRKPWSSSSSWSYHDDTGIGYSSAIDRRVGGTGRQAAALFGGGSGVAGLGGLDTHHYRSSGGGRTISAARSLGGVYDGNSLLYRCSTSNVPDHLERRWYQNQHQRQTGSSGGRLIRGLGGTKHLSDVYDDDDLLRLQQHDDATVAALLLDDVVLGGGYSGRNSDFMPSRPRSRSYGGGEDPSSSTSWRHWPDTSGGSGYLGGALRETAIGSSAAIYDHNGHRRATNTAINSATADQKRWDVRRHNRRQRRYSDGGGDSDPRRSYDYHQHLQTAAMMKYGTAGRRSRSWDPSPSPTPTAYLSGGDDGGGYGGYGGYCDYMDDYGGGGDYESLAALAAEEEHDEELQREEKKARIKAEIARRRRQIEDNVRLHEELLRLARIRENAEHEYSSSMLPSLSAAGR
uniref:Uncharacterized protein n=1 Tax=Schizaphis graminum TaxID=13262 RepID=A0A2S2NP61_SCHGA